MIKRLYSIAFSLSVVALVSACSGEKEAAGESVQVKGVAVEMGDRESALTSRATISGFSVNTGNDPTHENTRMTGAGGTWSLSVTIYGNNGQPYDDANGTWTYGTTSWLPSSGTLYMPSYFRPRVTADLYPSGRTSADLPEIDQDSAAKLLQQDLLSQNGDTYTVVPAHILSIVLRHKYSMIDFVLDGADRDDIQSVSVRAGGLTYTPYNVTAVANEYMVILPTGVANPTVVVETKEGAVYSETLQIPSTAINHCYCIKFKGVELLLSSVTVIDWTYGSALSGQYTTPTTYPTFQGNPGQVTTLYYDNGLSQEIEFDARGEITTKPVGRTITQIGDNILTTPLILDRMYIDLTGYLPTP